MNIKSYIFISAEGYTFQPESDFVEPEIENCQVLGFGIGENPQEAFDSFLNDNKFYLDLNFEEVICYELACGEPIAQFELKV